MNIQFFFGSEGFKNTELFIMAKAEKRKKQHNNVKVEIGVEWNNFYPGLGNVESAGYSSHTQH